MSILNGYRILDCSIAMAGPFAAQRLGDLGADVVKVEPTTGEWQRHVSAGGINGNEINVSFLSLNRNKRSFAVNLKNDNGREVLYELVKTADVFLQNYRPGVAKRLGVDYETLAAINPNLIYVPMSGYGETGPYQHRPGQDLLLQGMSGAMLSAGREGEPPLAAGQFLVDAITAYTAFEGVITALLHRERTGEGQKVEVNMLDAITTIQMQELTVYNTGKKPQERSAEPHAHVYIRAPYGSFETADGYIILATPPLKLLSSIFDEPAFADMEEERDGWTQRDVIFATTRKHLMRKTSTEWLEIFEENGIWAGPVYSYEDLANDPQIKHNGTFIEYEHPTEGTVKSPGFPIKYSKSPAEVRMGAPVAGQHTRELLASSGYNTVQIDALINEGAIFAGKDS